MNTFRRIRKNSKALSPVVASIILIAVTVAVSVVVAAWMGGTTIGLMGTAEKASVTNVQFLPQAAAADQLAVTVTNSGTTVVTINAVYVNGVTVPLAGVTVTTDGTTATDPANTISKSSSAYVTFTLPASAGAELSPGTAYTVKLITAQGTSVVSAPTTYNP